MFIGHFGVGFGSKALSPRTSLGSLFMAAQFVDLLWPTLLLAGVERVEISPGITAVTPLDFTYYPVSHSLLAVLVWGLLFGVAYHLVNRYRRGAIVCGAAVVSHWILDVLAHRPDLPLYPGTEVKAGLGLWQSLPATLTVEGTIFVAGVLLYLRTTRATDRLGYLALGGLVVFLVAIYMGNLLGAPPPNIAAIAWTGQAQWILVIWAYWVDRHRTVSR